MNDAFQNIGVRIPDLVSGFAGGVVNALFFQRANPGAAVASVVGGAITANYFATIVSLEVSKAFGPLDVGVSGFIVGVTAMAICQGLLAVSSGWMKRFRTDDPDV